MTSAEKYLRERIAQRYGQKTAIASDSLTRKHLRACVSRFGAGVLQPLEVRILERLDGKQP
jgi:hypothetical protein